ncbi:class D sortase [Paenibacillus sp. FSL K6-1566]|uniref:class D sortase n=1 Tax=Paenibacillus sp. FSL K6-1566 TaxID=2954515 RepID=UPI003101240E
MSETMIKRALPVLFIIAGIILIFYPKLTERVQQAEQEQLAREWQDSLQQISVVDDRQASGNQESNEAAGGAGTSDHASTKSEGELEVMLAIPKIDLKLPVLHGATKENLRTTLASIEHTGRPGEIGNFAVAGHRNRTYGRNFNRLDELAVGDAIEVDTGTRVFKYEVTEKLIVKPEEVWVLESDGKNKEVTLVTCHPMVNPTHRLIIKGKIIS